MKNKFIPCRHRAYYTEGDTLELQNGTKATITEVKFGWVVGFYYVLDNGAYYIQNYEF